MFLHGRLFKVDDTLYQLIYACPSHRIANLDEFKSSFTKEKFLCIDNNGMIFVATKIQEVEFEDII